MPPAAFSPEQVFWHTVLTVLSGRGTVSVNCEREPGKQTSRITIEVSGLNSIVAAPDVELAVAQAIADKHGMRLSLRPTVPPPQPPARREGTRDERTRAIMREMGDLDATRPPRWEALAPVGPPPRASSPPARAAASEPIQPAPTAETPEKTARDDSETRFSMMELD